jgi:AcrR family transcriptional regulator
MAVPARATRCCAEERRRQILETATQLFASQGFGGTTTRQIAEVARVNEALIFRHFPTKDELYWAVLEHKCEEGRGRKIIAEHLARNASPRETLAGIASAFFESRQQDATLGRLLLFSALERHTLSRRFFRTHIADLYDSLAQYIRERIAAGEFREMDPLLAARSFWGMVIYHFQVQELFGGKEYQEIEIDRASRVIADVWLEGMLPRNRSNGEGRGRRAHPPAGGAAKSRGKKGKKKNE